MADYILSQGQNETVQLIEGDFDALELEDQIAGQDGLKHSLIHAIYTSDTDLSPEQLQHMRQAMREEYGIPQDAPSMLVIHEKVGRDGVLRKHGHEVVSIKDEQGRVANTFRSKKRDELVSRKCEVDFGMDLVPGRHSDFVYKASVERNLDAKYQEAFQPIAHLKERARYSSVEGKIATRQGFDIHHWTSGLENVSRMPEVDQPKAFAELVNQFDGGEFRQGERGRSRLLVSFGDDGENLRNANKILKIKAAKVADFVAAAQESFDELRRRDDGRLSGADATGRDATGVRDDARARPEPGTVHGSDRSRASGDLGEPDVSDAGNEVRHEPDHRVSDAQGLERGSSTALDRADGRNLDADRRQDRPRGSDEQVQVRPPVEQSEKSSQEDGRDSAASSNRLDVIEPEVAARTGELSEPPSEARMVEPRHEFDFSEAAIKDEDVYRRIQRQHHRRDYNSVSDRLRTHSAAKEAAAQPEEPKVTIRDRLARTWVAQKVQPLLDKLRSRNQARRGRSAFDPRHRENLKDKLEALRLQNSKNNKPEESRKNDTTIIRGKDASDTRRRAEKAQPRDSGASGPGSPGERRAAHSRVVGRSPEGQRSGSRAAVESGAAAKPAHSVLRALGDRVEGRKLGRAAREIEPMRKSFADNDSIYNTATDLQVMPDLDDTRYAEKALAAWARSMGHKGP